MNIFFKGTPGSDAIWLIFMVLSSAFIAFFADKALDRFFPSAHTISYDKTLTVIMDEFNTLYPNAKCSKDSDWLGRPIYDCTKDTKVHNDILAQMNKPIVASSGGQSQGVQTNSKTISKGKLQHFLKEERPDIGVLLFIANVMASRNDYLNICELVHFKNRPFFSLSFIFTFFITILIESSYFFYNKSKRHSPFLALPEALKENVLSLMKKHKSIIGDIYSRYPHGYLEGLMNTVEVKRKSNKSGGTITIFDVGISSYADFAQSLLGITKNSIYSTTYHPSFIELINLYQPETQNIGNVDEKRNAEEVQTWINCVNKRCHESKILVKRVQLIRENDKSCSSLYEDENAINALRNYLQKYFLINESGNVNFKSNMYMLDFNFTTNARKFFGEYIIFDEIVMIKYSFTFKILEVFFGGIVGDYVKGFENVNFKEDLSSIITKLIALDIDERAFAETVVDGDGHS